MMRDGAAIGFWRTVWLLLKTARRRSTGRQRRQQELLNQRSGRVKKSWGFWSILFGMVVMAVLHGFAAMAVILAVQAAQRHEVEAQGKIITRGSFIELVQDMEQATGESRQNAKDALEERYGRVARQAAKDNGGDPAQLEQRLRMAVATRGARDLIAPDDAEPGLAGLARSGPVAAVLGSLVVVWWLAMVVCQGEGLELDLQRRRHPMWEWLLSHPVGAGAVFFAEMLAPISANPTYWTAPLFVGILYGAAQDISTGVAAALLIGIPLTVAAACLGKALEIAALLRLPTRSRGAVIGMVSWFGYASMVSMFLAPKFIPAIVRASAPLIDGVGPVSWSLLGLLLGLGGDGSFSLLRGVAFGWGVSGLLTGMAVVFSARSIGQGLSGAFATDTLPARPKGKVAFGRNPLFRKEYLWFLRDRSAIVQAVLIPVTIAGFQLFNLRGLLEHAEDSWNYLSGAAIFFGTYFLWVLGPKSLASEGSALWIALTWPQGLESILKAKARLWSLITSVLVGVILLAACVLFPHDGWKIALVALGWFAFARSMAEKSVTLVTVVSESGEAQKISQGRRWAAQLGMVTFALGICTQQWNLAVVGIVYSWITAAAMWENLRARLPYLYDPWSEVLPEPPTLMHAMVAISLLVECSAVVTGIAYAIGGKDSLAVARGVGYGVCAVLVSLGVARFLWRRGVSPLRIWRWDDAPGSMRGNLGWLLAGVGGGLLLGLVAHLYLLAASHIPVLAETIDAGRRQMRDMPGMATAYAVIAIGFAPFAEEYLFRGLLFRALDRHWGGGKAVVGAAAFFAIYHPPLSWLPVALVGAANCVLFKRSGRLAPAVLLHMVYNAVVTLWV